MRSAEGVAKPVVKARTRKRLAPSKISGPLVFFGRFVLPAYLRIALRFRGVEIMRPEAVVSALRDFQEKRTRLIVAFRHPYGDEPQLLFHVFEQLIPRCARRMRTPLLHRPGLRPVHDYAVALWGDAVIRFILPRVGGVPVYHSKYDSISVNAIRAVMKDGLSPLMIAPEGQISYHAETLPRIEQGTVRMGFWCARDLEKAGRAEQVTVLPLSVHYRYRLKDLRKVHAALARVEALCGLDAQAARQENHTLDSLLPRIERIETRLLETAEAYYTEGYGYPIPGAATSGGDDAASRHDRWMALLPFALTVAEQILGIKPESGDPVQRMYRVRQIGWDRIYPEHPVELLHPLEAALADRQAGEAWYAMRHMELFDLMEYHDASYLDPAQPGGVPYGRLVEAAATVEDLAYRLMGGNIVNRPNRIRKTAVLVPGKPINLTASLPQYHTNAKQTVQALTDELAGQFLNCIEEYQNGRQEGSFHRA